MFINVLVDTLSTEQLLVKAMVGFLKLVLYGQAHQRLLYGCLLRRDVERTMAKTIGTSRWLHGERWMSAPAMSVSTSTGGMRSRNSLLEDGTREASVMLATDGPRLSIKHALFCIDVRAPCLPLAQEDRPSRAMHFWLDRSFLGPCIFCLPYRVMTLTGATLTNNLYVEPHP